ncbi:MFS transporter [Microbispora cellulosiformans]|uniref:MFS transporter n=1 Tax=Microbispora cellulosiformans TaxID=2614688 RepID=A0A5J5JTT3_9ACTN|nr:MFS transporter [Microbispora cellulosiformans]KAA9373320.1 MFS transporter [Microbispora cellulosiformans]
MTEKTQSPDTGEAITLIRNRDFVRLWLSQTLSAIGSRVSYLAYPLLILAISGSTAAAGAVAGTAALVEIAVRIPAGVLLDRFDRRKLMLWTEAARVAAMITALTAAALDWISVPLVFAVAAMDAGGSALFESAERTVLRHIVAHGQITVAIARNEARTFTAELLGPALGGALFGLARALPFLFNTVAYATSFFAVLAIRRPFRGNRPEQHEGIAKAFAAGFGFIWRQPFLRAVAMVEPLLNMAFTGTLFVIIVVLHDADIPAFGIGVAMAAMAVGGILGAVASPWIQRLLSPRLRIVLLAWTSALMAATCVVLPSGYWVVAPMPILVFFAPCTTATVLGHQTAITPDHLHGRVVAALRLFMTGMNPIAPLAAGVLLEHLESPAVFAVFASVFVLASVVATFSKGIRTMGEHGRPESMVMGT